MIRKERVETEYKSDTKEKEEHGASLLTLILIILNCLQSK